ncbi:MAG: winged helix-turn-helix domain-containing protein [Erythrobacter sp.]|nr:MAG: winged helix-turn-helix domain-containing protein [Erythrobacter sp.]
MDHGVTRFGKVELDAAHSRLTVNGRRVEIDRPCIAILAILLSDPGSTVDKDRLLEAGWPGRVVHENSLAKAIGRLRIALGEDGHALRTVHGYGYRLETEPEPAATSAVRPATPRLDRNKAALIAASLAVGVLATWWLVSAPRTGSASELSALQRGEAADAVGRVLWVDDNPDNNSEETSYLERRGIAVYQAPSTEQALALLEMYDYNAVISDMNRGETPLAGLELVREMRRRNDPTPFFLYTVVPSVAQERLLAEAGGQRAAVTSDELYAALLPLFEIDDEVSPR